MIELLVVIGIIGILSGIMLTSFSGGTASARATQCLSNMRNLAAACQTYGAREGRYPMAGSVEYMTITEESNGRRVHATYYERPGWISWASKGAYAKSPRSKQASASWMLSAYSNDDDGSLYCLTNGALWKYVSGNRQTYVCQDHVRKYKKNPPHWSYLMNSYFGWDYSKGSKSGGHHYIEYGRLKRADRFLLFAEMQFLSCGLPIVDGGGSGESCDMVLQYKGVSVNSSVAGNRSTTACYGSGNELIGVNHKNGRNLYAHVAFADGHVEKLNIPYTGSIKNPQVDESMVRNLTGWLCQGNDISFNGKKYEVMSN